MLRAIFSTLAGLAVVFLPEARAAETPGADWPRVRHDSQLTGLSPLKGGLDQAPKEIGPLISAGRRSGLKPYDSRT